METGNGVFYNCYVCKLVLSRKHICTSCEARNYVQSLSTDGASENSPRRRGRSDVP